MKHVLWAGVAIAAMAGTASANTGGAYSGYVDASYTRFDADGNGADLNAAALSAAAAVDLRGRFQTQFDAELDNVDGVDNISAGGTIHLVDRHQGWMLGGLVGGFNPMGSDGDVVTIAGLEGAFYFRRITLTGAVAYANSDALDGDGLVGQAEARYFFDRNFRVDLAWRGAKFDLNGGRKNANAVTLGGEYRFSGSMASVFADYTWLNTDIGASDANLVRLGVRINLDADLAARDESGASLLTAPSFAKLF